MVRMDSQGFNRKNALFRKNILQTAQRQKWTKAKSVSLNEVVKSPVGNVTFKIFILSNNLNHGFKASSKI